MNVPMGVEVGTHTVKAEVPVPVSSETELGFATAVMLVVAGGVAFRFTLPVNPLRLESCIAKVATEPGFRVSEGGAKPMLKSGTPDPAFRVPRIKAEEAYAPPVTPIRRTMSKVYTGIGLFSWSTLTVPLLLNRTKALPFLIKAAIKGHKANGFRIVFSVRTNPDRFALRAILIILSDK